MNQKELDQWMVPQSKSNNIFIYVDILSMVHRFPYFSLLLPTMNQQMIGIYYYYYYYWKAMEPNPSRWKVGCTLKPIDLFSLDAQ